MSSLDAVLPPAAYEVRRSDDDAGLDLDELDQLQLNDKPVPADGRKVRIHDAKVQGAGARQPSKS